MEESFEIMAVDYAPIVIFAYKRISSVKQALQALQKDKLANKSEVFIFVDGYKDDGDKLAVEEVQNYLLEFEKHSIFMKLHLIFRKRNMGLAASVISGVSVIFQTYDTVIVVEDDLIVQGNFLQYMNDGLEYYKTNPRIWSISGFSPKLKSLEAYRHDVYVGYVGSSWGWGTWKNRWESVDWNVEDYNKYKYNIVRILKFSRGGNNLPSMLRAQRNGKIDSWAVRWFYNQSKQDMLTVFPTKSRVINRGFGEDATHTSVDEKKENHVDEMNEDCSCTFEDIKIQKRIMKDYRKYQKLTIKIRIRDKIREIQSIKLAKDKD